MKVDDGEWNIVDPAVYILSEELVMEALWWEWSIALAWTDLDVVLVLDRLSDNLTSLDEINFGPF